MNIFVNEYKRYRDLLLKTVDQLDDNEIFKVPGTNSNSIAVIIKHLSGNLLSRFTDFLSSDGEKDWREREAEFEPGELSRIELIDNWQKTWSVLQEAVLSLTEQDMQKTVIIRGVEFTVQGALVRSLAHFSYHVRQIVYLGKLFREDKWQYLSIAPGQSEAYNKNPNREKGFR